MAPTRESASATLIVVLGMHRSGTSVLARSMVALGADLGSHLQPPMAGVNDKGFFEDMDINAINMALMSAAGVAWDSLVDADLDRIPAAQRRALEEQAFEILNAKLGGKSFAFKDPRTSRLLSFWQPIFRRTGARVVYVIAVRHPLSVSASLAGHAGHIHPDATDHLLWLAHTLQPLTATAPAERIVVDYDRMLASPAREIARIAARLRLPMHTSETQVFADDFLDPALRTAHAPAGALEQQADVPAAVKALFMALQQAAQVDDESQATGLPGAIAAASQLWRDITPLLLREHDLRARTNALDGHVAGLQGHHNALASHISALEEQAATLTRELDAAHQHYRHLAQTLESFQRSLSWRVTAPLRLALDLVRGQR
ncbi:sulfotransferase family protein [Hydrogenophaga sp. OTU3427]|uniref:sulfotransferase family protein n=1 Tax=Hydrogenophaga sp. OTU3427 TaxID=3043856 RepID=UPI00313B03A5